MFEYILIRENVDNLEKKILKYIIERFCVYINNGNYIVV